MTMVRANQPTVAEAAPIVFCLLCWSLLLVPAGAPLLAQNADSPSEVIDTEDQTDASSLAISDRLAALRSESLANESLVDDAVDPTIDPHPPSTDIPSLVRKVRPSIALILTPTGHGTGVVVHSDGWIVTSYHVIEDAPWDSVSGFQIVRVYLGSQSPEGFSLIEQPLWGKVFKSNRRADLALLRLASLPQGLERVPELRLASKVPPEGSACYAIGMPARGVLWTVRSGTIAGHGELPGALNDHFRLGTNASPGESQRSQWQRMLAPEGKRMVTISTCGLNPGDSGGPLLNSEGQLVGVTYAVPSEVKFKAFGYHIHRDEVHEFLADLPPRKATIEPPSSVREASNCFLHLEPQAGVFNRVIKQLTLLRGEEPVAYFFDVDRQGVGAIAPEEVLLLGESELWKQCGIEWAVTRDRIPTYYFDLDTNGEIDLVFLVVDEEGDDVCRFELDGDKNWVIHQTGGDFLDTEVHFQQPEAQARYQRSRRESLPSLLRR